MATTSTDGYYYEVVVLNVGGLTTIDSELPFNVIRLTGTPTLSSSYTLTASNVGTGKRFWIKNEATIDLNGNTVTIFGHTIDQSIANIPFLIDAIYNGSTYDVTIIPSFEGLPIVSSSMIEDSAITTAKIADGDVTNDKMDTDSVDTSNIIDDAVETTKIADNAVTVAKLSDDLLVETIVIPVSFESGEQCDNNVVLYYAGVISEISATVTKAIASTDNATIVFELNGTPLTSSTITFTASDPLNTTETLTPASSNIFAADDVLTLTTAKSTAGGKALVSIKITRS